MSEQDLPVPPVPEHTPPQKVDEGSADSGKYFNHIWTRWFISLREKVNVINATVTALSKIIGSGFVVINNGVAIPRTLKGVEGRAIVDNADGLEGDPTIDVVTSNLLPGTNINFNGNGEGRLIDNGFGDLIINATGGGGGNNPVITSHICQEFYLGFSTSSAVGTAFINPGVPVSYFGSGSATTYAPAVGRPARLQLSVSGSSANRLHLGPPNIFFGGGTIRYRAHINIPILSDGNNSYQIAIGFFDRISGVPVNRITADYTHTVNDGNWIFNEYSNSINTVYNTSIPATTGDTLVEIVINADGKSAELFINDILAATSNTLNTSAALSAAVRIDKISGATARVILCDFIEVTQTLTTPRGLNAEF